MNIHLICIGQKMPDWIQTGYHNYAKRLNGNCQLKLKELPLLNRRSNQTIESIIKQEGAALLSKVPPDSICIALDEQGTQWTTMELATQLQNWLQSGQDIALLIGGPDGLSAACKARAQNRWSISALTLPHPLVRVLVAEAIYRAWTVLQNHPYHRQ